MTRLRQRGAFACLIAAGLLAGTGAVLAQRFRGGQAAEPAVQNAKYDGRFTFARLKFTTGPGGYYYRGLPAWAHGYPVAERNLTRILGELTFLKPHIEESNVIAMDDPELCKYPVAYMTEAGYWEMNDTEATAFRSYLQKGGFVIFDDSRDNFRGGGGWETFAAQMKRVLPEGRVVDLDLAHPVFHSFFEIPSLDIVPQSYDQGKPAFRGIFENNNPKKRLMVMVNFNTDVSDFWEFSGTGFRPVEESNEAYKLGVNYIMYGMTH